MSLAASHGTDRLLTLVNAAVLRATPEALGMLLLRDDPQFARIVSGSAPTLVAAALEDGRRLAASVRLAWGADPYAVARRRSIPVVQIDEDHCYGTTVVYAEYAERPPLIRLFGPSIGALNLRLADPRVRAAYLGE